MISERPVRALRLVAVVALLALGVSVLVVMTARSQPVERAFRLDPPPPQGYFGLRPPGSWHKLPGDSRCAGRVHRSAWEPRPDNHAPNHRMPRVSRVHRALAERPRARHGAYDKRWDSWLLARVTGHYTGTTDEIFQWPACKWGLDDNLLRALAMRESGWYQHEVYPDGTCVALSGCGDVFAEATPATRAFCARTDNAAGRRRYAVGRCPKTFSIVGVMSWQDPAWGRMPGNQNGTFPFGRASTAFAVDYLGGFLRGCYEGWVTWLENTGMYRPGDMRGCVGAWYDGSWYNGQAERYMDRVWATKRNRPWLRPEWARRELPCSPTHGCPEAPS